jgi:hypothetical protein
MKMHWLPRLLMAVVLLGYWASPASAQSISDEGEPGGTSVKELLSDLELRGGIDLLYDQVNTASTGGIVSQYNPEGSAAQNWDAIAADNFVVFEGTTWTVEQVFVRGFYSNDTPAGACEEAEVGFWSSTGTEPNEPLFVYDVDAPAGNTGELTLAIPATELAEGEYWLSVVCSGENLEFDVPGENITRWNWYYGPTAAIGAPTVLRNDGGGFGLPPGWNTFGQENLSFALFGSMEGDPPPPPPGPNFHEDFAGIATGAIPEDWTRFANDAAVAATQWGGFSAFGGSMRSNWSSSVPAGAIARDYLVTPALELGPNAELEFLAGKTFGPDYGSQYAVLISTTVGDDEAAFMPVLEFLPSAIATSGAGGTVLSVDLSDYAGETVYIAFLHEQDNDGNTFIVGDVAVSWDTTGGGAGPVATFIPSVEDGISATVAPGGMTTESFAIMNTGDEDLVFSIDIGAMLRDQHDGDLDEAFEVEDFTVVSPANGGTPVNFTLPAGVATSGTVVGFSFEGTVAGVSGGGTWASDLRMTLTSPAGESFSVGGIPAENPWDFQGGGSTEDGTYTSTHFGAFGEDGTPDAGDWQVEFVHGWNSTSAADMDWSNVTITLHKVGEGEPPVGSFIAGVSPMAGTVAPGSTETVTVTFDAEGFDEGTYMDYLTITTNEAMDLAALPLERREAMLATRGMPSTTYQYPVAIEVGDEGLPLVSIRNLNMVPQSNLDQLTALGANVTEFDLQTLLTNEWIGVPVRIQAVVLSDPRHSGFASINQGTGLPGRVHFWVRDLTSQIDGVDGQTIQVVYDVELEAVLELRVGDVIEMEGAVSVFTSGPQRQWQFQPLGPGSISVIGVSPGGSPERQPVVVTTSDLNTSLGGSLVQANWTNWNSLSGQYVRIEDAVITNSMQGARPNWAFRSSGDASRVANHDVSLRFRNDRENYPSPPFLTRPAGDPFVAPEVGTPVAVQGFVTFGLFDAFQIGQPPRVKFFVAPMADEDLTEIVEQGSPVASFVPSVEDGISATVAAGGMTTESFAIMNTGDADLVYDIELDMGAMLRNQHAPDLDEALAVDNFTVVSPAHDGTPVSFTLPAGVATSGTVVGFTFEGTVAGISGGGTWASDMRMTITSPTGSTSVVGGLDSTNPWAFQGTGSTDDGTYTSTHFGAFGEVGTPDAGNWEVVFAHTWNSPSAADMDWSNVTITLHKVTAGEPPVSSFIAGVSPMSGTVAPGSTETVTVTFDAEGFDEGTYMDYLTITTNEAMDMAALPVERREALATRGTASTVYSYPVALEVVGAAAPPVASVEPGSLDFSLGQNETATQMLTLSNVAGDGAADLDYLVTVLGAAPQASVPSRPLAIDQEARRRSIARGLAATEATATVQRHFVPTTASPNLRYRSAGEVILTHSQNMTIMSEPSPIGCANWTEGFSRDNSYWRVFDLAAFGIDDVYTVNAVDVGVWMGNSTGAATTVRLYTLDGAMHPANLTLVAQRDLQITSADHLSLATALFPGVTFDAGDTMVVEWAISDGEPTGHHVLGGQNAAGETGPTYLSSATCQLLDPTMMASIGFPDAHWVMQVRGSGGPGAVVVEPSAGSVAPGASQELAVTVTTEGLDAGMHSFEIQIHTNDPDTPVSSVPVSVSVSSTECVLSWQTAITASGAAGGSSLLAFGQGPDATDGIDAACGEMELPPPPPGFEARFILPDGTTGSYRDFRADTAEQPSWRISMAGASSDYPVTFTWDPGSLPAGRAFFLRDVVTGGSLVNVDLRTGGSYVHTNAGLSTLEIVEGTGEVTAVVEVAPHWNLLSVPIQTADMAGLALFPGAASNFFWFSDGYVSATTLQTGRGYWARFDEGATYELAGQPAEPQSVTLAQGWNMIGFFDADVAVSSLVSAPAGVVTSGFFGYADGYDMATSLEVGRGYWVKASAPGVLSVGANGTDAPPALNEALAAALEHREAAATLTITDAVGRTAALRFVEDASGPAFVLPPVPPAGAFDVRFDDHRSAGAIDAGAWSALLAGLALPATLELEGLDGALRVSDVVGGSLFDVVLEAGSPVLLDVALEALALELLRVNDEDGAAAATFELGSAYPNPAFSSAVNIHLVVPDAGHVRLVVYDLLGREVLSVLDREMAAGRHEVVIGAGTLASGSYLYRLEAAGQSATRRFVIAR